MQVDDGVGGLTTQIQNRYTHGGQVDEPLSLEVFASDGTLDQSYTYHADHLGSIRFVTDSVGTIVNAYEYDSYGRPGFELEQVSQPFRYTGREWDQATELYHYRARAYDPETGKFLQEDPIGFGAGDLNVYRYVGSNPVGYTDPSGFSAVGAAALNAHAAYAGGAGEGIGSLLGCIFNGVADAVALAGSQTVGDVNLKGCGAEAVRNGLVAGALGAIPLPNIMGAAWRANQARTASAIAFQMAKASGKNKGVVAALVTRDGHVFFGFSKKAGQQFPIDSRLSEFCSPNRRCAEIDAINNALRNGFSVKGAHISVRAVGSNSSKGATAGQSLNPCTATCQDALRDFGVTVAD